MSAFYAILDYADYNTRVISDIVDHSSVAYHRRYAVDGSALNKFVFRMKSLPERCFGSWYAKIELSVLFGAKLRDDTVCPVLLVYECNHLASNMKLLNGMKRQCPQLKLVLILTNIVGAGGTPRSHLAEQCKVFDMIVTFSEDDAKSYRLVHYEGMYSHVNLEGLREAGDDYEYDLYFCGRDKGRATTLVSIAEVLDRHSISYRFDIVGKSSQERNGFFYQRELISSDEMLRRASRAKTMLEVMANPNNRGSTLRPYEAYSLGIKLLSNNRFLGEKPWFNPRQISVFEDAGRIDTEFVCTPLKPEEAQDITVLSPTRFLEFVAGKFNLQFNVR